MTTTSYFSIWAGLFVLCAGLGFVPEPTGLLGFCLTALSVVFFIPPFLLLRHGARRRDLLTLQLVRNLSLASLVLTVLLIIGNFFSLMASEAVGNTLYILLTIISAPMACSGYWVLSLFLWACLLFDSLAKIRQCR